MILESDDVSTTVSDSSRHGIPEETLERIRKASDMPAAELRTCIVEEEEDDGRQS